MAGSRIRVAIPHHVEEKALGFDKVSGGLFRLIKQVIIKDTVTLAKISAQKQRSKELYELVEGDDFDYNLFYEEPDGTLKELKFRKTTLPESIEGEDE